LLQLTNCRHENQDFKHRYPACATVSQLSSIFIAAIPQYRHNHESSEIRSRFLFSSVCCCLQW